MDRSELTGAAALGAYLRSLFILASMNVFSCFTVEIGTSQGRQIIARQRADRERVEAELVQLDKELAVAKKQVRALLRRYRNDPQAVVNALTTDKEAEALLNRYLDAMNERTEMAERVEEFDHHIRISRVSVQEIPTPYRNATDRATITSLANARRDQLAMGRSEEDGVVDSGDALTGTREEATGERLRRVRQSRADLYKSKRRHGESGAMSDQFKELLTSILEADASRPPVRGVGGSSSLGIPSPPDHEIDDTAAVSSLEARLHKLRGTRPPPAAVAEPR